MTPYPDTCLARQTPPPSSSQSLPIPSQGNIPVAVVLGANAEVLDFCGPWEVFTGAFTDSGQPLFSLYTVAESQQPVQVGGGMKVVSDFTFANAPTPKIIVIPAMELDAATPAMLDWIRSASPSTDVTMSVCNGAFILAKSGLLAGKKVTCHHGGYFRFAGTFPEANLVRGVRWIEDGQIASSGGVSSGIDLALHIVERYIGRDRTLQIIDGMEHQGNGWRDPTTNQKYATLPKFDEVQPLCPLCLMEADRLISCEHDGKNYYFCAESEREFFLQHTHVLKRFLAEDEAHQQPKP